jgi:hypothetical protein
MVDVEVHKNHMLGIDYIAMTSQYIHSKYFSRTEDKYAQNPSL